MKAPQEQLKQLGKYEANALLAKELLQPASPENQLGYRTDIEDPEKQAEHLQEQMLRAANYLNEINETASTDHENMTIQEFNNTEWHGGISCLYQESIYEIGSCNFEEKLIGLCSENDDELIWVRCESIKLKTS